MEVETELNEMDWARRCVEAVASAEDHFTQQSLWNSALRYHREWKMRLERAGGLEIHTRSLPRAQGGQAHDLF